MSAWDLRQRWRTWRRHWAAKIMQEVGVHIMGLGGNQGAAGTRRAWSEAELNAWLETRLQPMQAAQTHANHKHSVCQLAVQVLIASHSNPDLLLRNWTANLPNVVDELHENIPQGDEALRALALKTWKDELAYISGLIERTVQARREADAEQGAGAAHRTPPDEALVCLVVDSQHLNATMSLLKMLIATHHDIRWLQLTWALNITPFTDALFDAPAPFGQSALKQVMLDAWRMTIQDYTRLIDEAVKQHGQDDA